MSEVCNTWNVGARAQARESVIERGRARESVGKRERGRAKSNNEGESESENVSTRDEVRG